MGFDPVKNLENALKIQQQNQAWVQNATEAQKQEAAQSRDALRNERIARQAWQNVSNSANQMVEQYNKEAAQRAALDKVSMSAQTQRRLDQQRQYQTSSPKLSPAEEEMAVAQSFRKQEPAKLTVKEQYEADRRKETERIQTMGKDLEAKAKLLREKEAELQQASARVDELAREFRTNPSDDVQAKYARAIADAQIKLDTYNSMAAAQNTSTQTFHDAFAAYNKQYDDDTRYADMDYDALGRYIKNIQNTRPKDASDQEHMSMEVQRARAYQRSIATTEQLEAEYARVEKLRDELRDQLQWASVDKHDAVRSGKLTALNDASQKALLNTYNENLRQIQAALDRAEDNDDRTAYLQYAAGNLGAAIPQVREGKTARALKDIEETLGAGAVGRIMGGGVSPTALVNGVQTLDASVARLLQYMDDAEKNALNTFVASGDWAHAGDFLDTLRTKLNAAAAKADTERIVGYVDETGQRVAGSGSKNFGAAAGSTFLAGTLGALGAQTAYFDNLYNALNNKLVDAFSLGQYRTSDVNSGAYAAARAAQDFSSAAQAYNAKVGEQTGLKELEQTLNQISGASSSALSNIIQMAMFGKYMLPVMSSQAAGMTTTEMLRSGASAEDAAFMSTASGLVEYMTEKLPLEHMLERIGQIADLKKGGMIGLADVMRMVRDQGMEEASEEVIGNIAENLIDIAYNGSNSEFGQFESELRMMGYSNAEARSQAFNKFFVGDSMQAAVSAFLSSAMLLGATGVVQGSQMRKAGNQVLKNGSAIEEAAKALNLPDSEDYAEGRKAGQRVQEALDAGKRIDPRILGYAAERNSAYAAELIERGADLQYSESQAMSYVLADRLRNGETITDKELQTFAAQIERDSVDHYTSEQLATAGQNIENATPKMSYYATQFMRDAGLSAKDAQERCVVLNDLLRGETDIPDKDFQKLDMDSAVTRRVFTELTGIEIPEGIHEPKDLMTLYKRAPEGAAIKARQEAVANDRAILEQANIQQQKTENLLRAARIALQQAAQERAEATAAQQRAIEESKARNLLDRVFGRPKTKEETKNVKPSVPDRSSGRDVSQPDNGSNQQAHREESELARDGKVRATGERVSAAELKLEGGSAIAVSRTYKQSEYTDEMKSVAQENKKIGVKTVFLDHDLVLRAKNGDYIYARGVWDPETKTIYINANHSRWSVEEINGHEMFHAMKDDIGLSMEDARDQFVADYGQETYDHIVDSYEKGIGSGLTDLEYFEEFLADANGGMRGVKGVDAAAYHDFAAGLLNGETKNTGHVMSGVKTSIETLPDGKQFVKADRQVIFGNDEESWRTQLEDYINGKIRRGEDVQLIGADGDVLTLTADTAGKVSSHLMGKNWVDGETYERKLNAGAHIDELVEVSKRDSAVEPDEGGVHGEMAQYGWVYRRAYFLDFDNKYYEVELSTALGPDGTTVYNVGKMTRRTFPAIYGSSAQGGAQLRKSSSSDATVAQKTPDVKNEIKTSVDTEYDFARDLDDWVADGMPAGEQFTLGSSGEVLQGLGALDQSVYMNGDKIQAILDKHPEMTIDDIKKLPYILAHPILIIADHDQARHPSRIVLFGNETASDDRPIMVSYDLLPKEKDAVGNWISIDDMQKVVSSFTKDRAPKQYMRDSTVLYVTDNKKEIDHLLSQTGHNLPAQRQRSLTGYNLPASRRMSDSFLGSITYEHDPVNNEVITGVEVDGIPFDDLFHYLPDDYYDEAVRRNDTAEMRELMDEAAATAGAILDADGNPKTFYVGVQTGRNRLRNSDIRNGPNGYGFYLESDQASAAAPGKTVRPVYAIANELATTNDHRITPYQVRETLRDLGVPESRVFPRTTVEAWLRGKNDVEVAKQIQNWAQRLTSYLPDRILRAVREGLRYDGIEDGGNVTLWSGSLAKYSDAVTLDDNGDRIPLSDRYNPVNRDLRFSQETDPEVLDKLENEPTVTVYRAMQEIDGKLYPPMAARVDDGSGKRKLVEPTTLGTWYRADEHPELVDKNGKFKLDKANGSTIDAAYNPYWHTSRSLLNDQFSSAHKRPNLVTVECEVPVSELSSGYRAEGAKDAVGEMYWHSGPVSAQLAKLGNPRRVILSRWVKVNRVVPDAEAARNIAQMLRGTGIDIPANTVTPSLRSALEAEGVRVTESGRVRFSQDTDNEQRLDDLEAQRQEIIDQLDFAEGSETKELNNRLAKVNYEIDRINAEERRAAVSTPIGNILKNLDDYRRIDLISIGNQYSGGNWDGIESMTKPELVSELRDVLQNQADEDPGIRYYVRPVTSQNDNIPLFQRFDKKNPDIRFSQDSSEEVIRYSQESEEGTHLKDQIRAAQDYLNSLPFATELVLPNRNWMDKPSSKKWFLKYFEKEPEIISNPYVGEIDFDAKSLGRGIDYLHSAEEIMATAAVPAVMKRGHLIFTERNHKGNGFDTITIAGRVRINGTPGNMAVVLKKIKGLRYKTHQILLPNGELFEFREKTNAESRTAGVSPDRLTVGEGSISPSNSALPGATLQSPDAYAPWFTAKTDAANNAPDTGTVSQPGSSVKTSVDTDLMDIMREQGADMKVWSEEAYQRAYDTLMNMSFAPNPTELPKAKESVGAAKSAFEHRTEISKFRLNTLNAVTTQAEQQNEGLREEDMTYDVVTEKESVAGARARLEQDFDGEVNDLMKRSDWSGEDVDTAMLALGVMLDEGAKSGDYNKAVQLAQRIRERATQGGQFVQAFAKYSRHTGAGLLVRNLETMEKIWQEQGIEESKKKHGVPNDIPGRLTQAKKNELIREMTETATTLDAMEQGDTDTLIDIIVRQAKLRNTRVSDRVLKDLRKTASEPDGFQYLRNFAETQFLQIPLDYKRASLGKRLSTYQTISHLFNLRTAGRNVVSNTVFDVAEAAANNLAVGIDAVVGNVTGQRTIGWDASWFSKAKRAGAAQGARRSAIEASLDVKPSETGDKYGTANRTNKMVGNAFERFLSSLEKAMGYELNVTDEFAKGGISEETLRGLQQFVDAGKLTTEEAAEIAKQEMLYRTFQDETMASNVLKGLKQTLNKVGFPGGEFGLGDLVCKYTQVPGALLTRQLEFSPFGYLKTISLLAHMAKMKGKLTAMEQRNLALSITRATTGTGLIMLFAALAKAGIMTRPDDRDDADARALRAASGITGTQFNLSAALRALKGESYERQDGDTLMDIAFLEPLSGLMTIGTLLNGSKADAAVGKWADSMILGTWQAFSDLSVMSTIKTLKDAITYADGETGYEKTASIALEFAMSNVSGFIPSPIRQTAQAFDPFYRDSYGSTDAATNMKYQVMSAIPGLREKVPEKLTAFGDTKEYGGSAAQRFLNAFINPGNVRTYRSDPTAEKVLDVYEKTGDATIIPDRNAARSVTFDKQKYVLTDEQRREYLKTAGATEREWLDQLFQSDEFNALDPTEQAALIKSVNSKAKDFAKTTVLNSAGVESMKLLSPEVQREIDRLGVAGETGLSPSIPTDSTISVPGRSGYEYQLTDAQMTAYQKLYRDTYEQSVSDLISSDAYKAAGDEEKAGMIRMVRDYVRDSVKAQTLADDSLTPVLKADDNLYGVRDAVLNGGSLDSVKQDLLATATRDRDMMRALTPNASGIETDEELKEKIDSQVKSAASSTIKSAYVNGEMTEKQAVDALMKYGVSTKQTEAKQTLIEAQLGKSIGTAAKDGDINEKEYTKYYLDTHEGKTENDAFWAYQSATGGEGYKMYNRLADTVRSQKNLTETIRFYTEHGKDEEDLRSAITSAFKPEFVAATDKEREAMMSWLVTAYTALGLTEYKARKNILKWLDD